MNTAYTPPTEEQKAERRKAATHKRCGTLFQLSRKGEDFYPQAWWFNEGSGMWQWHDLTNDEVRKFSPANAGAVAPPPQRPATGRDVPGG